MVVVVDCYYYKKRYDFSTTTTKTDDDDDDNNNNMTITRKRYSSSRTTESYCYNNNNYNKKRQRSCFHTTSTSSLTPTPNTDDTLYVVASITPATSTKSQYYFNNNNNNNNDSFYGYTTTSSIHNNTNSSMDHPILPMMCDHDHDTIDQPKVHDSSQSRSRRINGLFVLLHNNHVHQRQQHQQQQLQRRFSLFVRKQQSKRRISRGAVSLSFTIIVLFVVAILFVIVQQPAQQQQHPFSLVLRSSFNSNIVSVMAFSAIRSQYHFYYSQQTLVRRRFPTGNPSSDLPLSLSLQGEKSTVFKYSTLQMQSTNNNNSNETSNPTTDQQQKEKTSSKSLSSSSSSTSSSSTNKKNATIKNRTNNINNNKNTTKSNNNYRYNNNNNNNNNNYNNKNSGSNNSKSSKNSMTTKQELVKAIGESIKATRNKQQQQSQGSKNNNKSNGSKKQQAPSSSSSSSSSSSILNNVMNPFQAGQQLRQSIDSVIKSSILQSVDPKSLSEKSQYYIDDRFMERSSSTITSSSSTSTNPYSIKNRYLYNNIDDENDPTIMDFSSSSSTFVPEILVVGATGRVGRLIVRQLLQLNTISSSSATTITNRQQQQQNKRVRVRVLVRDLYTRTLDILGTGVTYCQGDLLKMDTLEDAVTDIDKLIFVAAPSITASSMSNTSIDLEEHRIKMAEQIDLIGMSNLIQAYQNVRHADYGTSQAAKRTLFKFGSSSSSTRNNISDIKNRNINNKQQSKNNNDSLARDDFFLFAIDDGDDIVDNTETAILNNDSNKQHDRSKTDNNTYKTTIPTKDYYDEHDIQNNNNDDVFVDTYSEEDPYAMYDDEYGSNLYNEGDNYDNETNRNMQTIEVRRDATIVKTQSRWTRNAFNHGVFVGRIPYETQQQQQQQSSITSSKGGETAIISSRLRSRDDPEMGIELGPNFGGFICRVCSDGNRYEAFVRTGSYHTDGIEYVCEFTTSMKDKIYPTSTTPTTQTTGNTYRNKFVSIRLPFTSFKPVRRKIIHSTGNDDDSNEFIVPPFRGYDVRYIGFRYRSILQNQNNNNNNDNSNSSIRRMLDRKTGVKWDRFYFSINYIKVYRTQPEPEFVYVSDAGIPHKVHDNMIQHETKQILTSYEEEFSDPVSSPNLIDATGVLKGGTKIQLNLQGDDATSRTTSSRRQEIMLQSSNKRNRIPEETYYKYRGEELLKKSGLSYAIVRVGELCDSPASIEELNDIELSSTQQSPVDVGENDQLSSSSRVSNDAISRADIAQICIKALLDPNALNKSFYVHRRKSLFTSDVNVRKDLSTKFASLPTDT